MTDFKRSEAAPVSENDSADSKLHDNSRPPICSPCEHAKLIPVSRIEALVEKVRALDLDDDVAARRHLELGLRIMALFPDWDADIVVAFWDDTGHSCLVDDDCYVCEQMAVEGWL